MPCFFWKLKCFLNESLPGDYTDLFVFRLAGMAAICRARRCGKVQAAEPVQFHMEVPMMDLRRCA